MTNLLIIGNGPSTKIVDFDKIKIDTFCVNNSFKSFKKLNFYPKYFGSFDRRHCVENREAYIDLVRNSPIEKFIIPSQYIEDYPDDVKNNMKVVKFKIKYVKRGKDLKYPTSFKDYKDGGNSGVNAVLCGYLLDYQNIYLIGCDASYDNSLHNDNNTISETLKIMNKNYWFDDYYDKKTDIQFIPTLRFHKPFWNYLYIRKPKNLNLYNCSNISALKKIYQFKSLDYIYSLDV